MVLKSKSCGVRMLNHKTKSFLKSAVRILGYVLLGFASAILVLPAIVLVASEIIGIIEEFGE